MLKYHIKQRDKVLALNIGVERSCAVSSGAVDNRAFELFVVGVEIEQKLQHLIYDLLRSCVGTVGLIYDNNDLVTKFKRLLEHEPCLRHSALEAVHKQENAVYHFKDTLDLAGEIGMSGGIDDVDLYVLVCDGGVFGEYRYSAFTLKGVAVHYAVNDSLIFAVNAALFEHFVNQCGLAVVDMGNYRDISEIFSFQCLTSFFLRYCLYK